MTYDVSHFIDKFEAIPDEKWATRVFITMGGGRCALGHCGVERADMPTWPPESEALRKLFRDAHSSAADVNDGFDLYYQQPTPKARILAALRDLL